MGSSLSLYAWWCNGSTTDSDSVCLGSNPSRAAMLILNNLHKNSYFLAIKLTIYPPISKYNADCI